MMNYVCAYEIVALFLIGLVTFFYHYNNWLPLYRNRLFSSMLYVLLFIITVEITKRMGEEGVINLSDANVVVLTKMSFIAVIICAVLLWIYYLAQTLSLGYFKGKNAVAMLMPAVLVIIYALISGEGGSLFYVKNGVEYYNENSMRVFSVFVMFYIISGAVMLGRTKNKIPNNQYKFMQVSNIVLICFLALYYVPRKKLMLIYYCVAAVVIIYYLIRHNVDIYIVSASECFSMAGFKKVLEEKIKYKKNYYCISVCASSMQNMSNYCLEEEINQVHAIMGEYLRKFGGRHNVYHIHSYEYVILTNKENEVNDLFVKLRKELPKTIRLNDKSISMYYKFYIVGNQEAKYTLSEFMRIILSLKKIAMEDSLDREIVVYNGSIRERIEKELENIRTIKNMLETDDCELECMPIYDVKSKDVNEFEVNPVILVGNRQLPIEEVWNVSREIGCSKDINILFFKKILQFVSEEKLFERGVKHIRINMAAFHIISESICQEYMDYIREYNINPENIIIELMVNGDVPEDVLAKSIKYFRMQGIHVFWDQFGIQACNLKNLMDMSFDGVKINHTIVSMYCHEKSMQLIYLIRMFRERKWSVCLDGINYPEGFNVVTKMDVDYIQGKGLMTFVPKEKIREFLLKKGGILGDI